jgi:hypothetical protein
VKAKEKNRIPASKPWENRRIMQAHFETKGVTMLDIRFIREHADAVKAAMINRNADVDVDAVLEFDNRRRAIISEVDT